MNPVVTVTGFWDAFVTKIAVFLPNLLFAVAIILLGWVICNVIKRVVVRVLLPVAVRPRRALCPPLVAAAQLVWMARPGRSRRTAVSRLPHTQPVSMASRSARFTVVTGGLLAGDQIHHKETVRQCPRRCRSPRENLTVGWRHRPFAISSPNGTSR
mgnify:CR=1 FL=1